MTKSNIRDIRILKSDVSGTPLLQITTDDQSSHGFYVNEHDATKLIDAISNAYKNELFRFWLADLRLYNALKNSESTIK